MTEEGLLKIYELFFKRVEFNIDIHQKRLNFFWSIISAITGAIVVGVFNIKTNSQYFIIALGPLLIFIISYVAKNIIHRDKEDLLQNVAVMVKLESLLGLTCNSKISPIDYWVEDSIISKKHVKYRKKFNNSEEFVNNTLKSKGIHATYMNIFTFLQFFSVLLFFLFILLAII